MMNQLAQEDLLYSNLNPGQGEPSLQKNLVLPVEATKTGGQPEVRVPRVGKAGRTEAVDQTVLAQPVRGLQQMLRRLSGYHRFLPEVEVDGVFGERTMEAVMLFQREMNLPVTGMVDWVTWNTIRDQWMELEAQMTEPRAIRAFPGEGCWVEPGANREFMILPQTMFQVLSRQFNGITLHEVDGTHNAASLDNVRWLQWAAGMEETGIMDAMTWGILSKLYEMFVVKDGQDNRAKFAGGRG